jgi:hypothetical protein
MDILRDPDGLAAVQSCVMAGEDARAFAEIPLNLSIADDKLALITFAGDALNARNAVLVHRPRRRGQAVGPSMATIVGCSPT